MSGLSKVKSVSKSRDARDKIKVLECVFGAKCIMKGCVKVRITLMIQMPKCGRLIKMRVACFRMRVPGQTRHDELRSVRRIEGFGVCFWVKRSTKSRDG